MKTEIAEKHERNLLLGKCETEIGKLDRDPTYQLKMA